MGFEGISTVQRKRLNLALSATQRSLSYEAPSRPFVLADHFWQWMTCKPSVVPSASLLSILRHKAMCEAQGR